MSSQNKKFISPALHSSISKLIQKSNLTPSTADQSGGPESPAQGNSVITCILHGNINNPVDMVDCTRLAIIQDRGTKKAWQVVVSPSVSDSFSLVINSVTVGPFSSTATGTSTFQDAVNAAIPTDTPRCWVVHGNFFVYPAASVSFSAEVDGDIYQVPWMPLVGNGFKTRVGTRRLAKSAQFLRGSTQAAEWVNGYGYAIASAAASDDLPTGGGGGCCSCTCIDSGDIIVAGKETTSRWNVDLGKVSESQEHGTISVLPHVHELVWDEGLGYWKADVDSELLVATYNSGTDATADTTMSAELIFRRNDGGYTTLTMSITGTVPEEDPP